MKTFVFLASLVIALICHTPPAWSATIAAAENKELAALYTAAQIGKAPITNKQNQTLYIVDLKDGTDLAFPDARGADKTESDKSKFQPRHGDRVKNMVEAFQTDYAFDYYDMTSWVGLSFTTYLNEGQLQKIRRDARVSMVTEVTTVEFSQASPPWSNSPNPPGNTPNPAPANFFNTAGGGWPIDSWGRIAVNGKVSTAAAKTRVYVLDAGVGNHVDLNVISRVNPSCSTSGTNCIGLPSIGCYSHATHVAGIIGAKDNALGVRGVNAGAPIVSVSFMPYNNVANTCVDYDPAATLTTLTNNLVAGLDWIKSDLASNSVGRVGVVNISANGTVFLQPSVVSKMYAMTQPIYVFWPAFKRIDAFAFISQSAGNRAQDACNFSYAPAGSPSQASTSDGIMVVGAHDAFGNTSGAFNLNNSNLASAEAGSNYGSCVDVWAPGHDIYSSWGDSTQLGNGTIYNNYARLSGTSMAAPHIAGIAAWLAETYNPASPSALETLLRNSMNSAGRIRLP